ncbi:putative metalloprotease CJM1_0395 family protein [Fontimonas sp. SYSU GA230001]|uniref:putative metalloprotease CJM1_0395 family protein n=1 Tax=Fontimonas sp. SYSU GA230001 TaxID=3142450 RepID=UPI0032B4BBFF
MESVASTPLQGQTGGLAEDARLRELQRRDQQVRRHELAHRTVGSPYTSPARFDYQTGPDGRRYAVGGEVRIDAAPVAGDLEATVAKMRIVIAAALAPVDPSTQDRAVAARAGRELQQATIELRREQVDQALGPYREAPPRSGAAIDVSA